MQSHTGGENAHIRHVVAQNLLQGCFSETECAVRALQLKRPPVLCAEPLDIAFVLKEQVDDCDTRREVCTEANPSELRGMHVEWRQKQTRSLGIQKSLEMVDKDVGAKLELAAWNREALLQMWAADIPDATGQADQENHVHKPVHCDVVAAASNPLVFTIVFRVENACKKWREASRRIACRGTGLPT